MYDAMKDRVQLHALRNELDVSNLPPHMDDLVTRYGLQARRLAHGFRVLFQDSIYHYWMKRAMQRARVDLEADCPIKTLAVKYGYSTYQNFSRAFKQIHGITPGDVIILNTKCRN